MAGGNQKKTYGYTKKVGEEITIYFTDGKALKGKLIKVFQYDIIIEIVKNEEPIEVTVFKGAVKYII
ncbi:hypothetical protein MUN88_20785 [Gracilibacillus caseinilyticus]|uniref:DUF2187 domain-containing protein n=1 Tax=Gracilibacillus caseinilyticus TaxID=2932256 RepID=A0ABY4EWM6_9BACI|nr:hypothetical protein [Gracilibacillus caseinilyticus]UOQ48436.1 hypothetical protein MUN88_20785 [Gracilibacillus caseinilyticus]